LHHKIAATAASDSMKRPRTMTSAHSLQGLMKWLTRAEWRDRFAEVYDHHLLPACRRTGLDAEEVMEILGESWFMTTVWGSAFEDFLTREGADGHNVVDDYLKRRGWKESASTRAYMSALRTSVMSLYEVSDIVRDTSFRARDLVRGGDPILISERSATRSLKQWDRITTRVVQVGSQMLISGAVLPYDRDASEKVLKLLRNVAKRTDKEQRKLADLVHRDVNHPAIVNAFSQTALLRAAAPAITTVWLIDMIDRAKAPQIPEVRNAEGDELLFCTVHYPFADGTAAEDIRLALNRCPELRQENATFWNWIGPRRSVKTLGAQKRPLKSLTFATTLDDSSLVFGSVELKDKGLILSVNSQARAERGRLLLSETLDGLVAQPLVEIQTLEQCMVTRDPAPAPNLNLSEEKRRTLIHDGLDRHYRDLLDQPIPVLGNKSPRAAVKTAKGRAKVVDWLKTLENHTAKFAGSNDEMATYNFNWLWTELGINELKR
jgi:hypothetical protein